MPNLSVPRLLGLGTAVPSTPMPQQDWSRIARRIAPAQVAPSVIERLAQRSGITTRHCDTADRPDQPPFYPADPQGKGPSTSERMRRFAEAARPMAAAAADRALRQARVEAGRITHVVTACCTGFEAPGPDQWLIQDLGLPASARRTHIGFMGCHAAVNALAVAASLAAVDLDARVLVCCVEVCSVHLHYGDRLDRLIANTLFADGAAAAIVGAGPEDAPILQAFHSVLLEDSVGEMAWTVGDHGFEMTLGARVPEILGTQVGPWIREMLRSNGLASSDVGGWAIHPGGPRVIDAVLQSLELPERAGESSRQVLRSHGNMSSATLLFIIDAMRASGLPRPWVGMAFGPGLAGEALLLA
jgi:predicted naringenin-chalcone synthase